MATTGSLRAHICPSVGTFLKSALLWLREKNVKKAERTSRSAFLDILLRLQQRYKLRFTAAQ